MILYRTADDSVRVEVLFKAETFWLDQRRMAELFGVELPTVSYHLKAIYDSQELDREATLRKIQRVQREGNRDVRREIEFYNLDAIISVGYRVNSTQATQFRIWATQTLRDFIVKGFVLDDERLKLNKRFGKDYFDELLERIREIRASERRFYLKITDIYEQCSIDYDAHAVTTQAARQIPMKMADWVAKLDTFLQFNEYEVLTNAGKVSAEVAKHLAEERYDTFRVRQDQEFESDFEAEVKRIGAIPARKTNEGS